MKNDYHVAHQFDKKDIYDRDSKKHASSSANLSHSYAFSSYEDFAENLYPKYPQQKNYQQIYNEYTKFDQQQQQVGFYETFQLAGVLEHTSAVSHALRLTSGEILTCSQALTFWEYPSLKQL